MNICEFFACKTVLATMQRPQYCDCFQGHCCTVASEWLLTVFNGY